MKKIKNKYVKTINLLAFPILMNYLISSIFEIMDKAIVGHYSTEGFAGVGVAASVIYVITGSFGILAVAYNIVAAEIKGKCDDDMFEKAFCSAMMISIVIGIAFTLISLLGGRVFFKYVYGLHGNVLELLLRYYYPASVTVLLNMVIFLFSTYFRNKHNTKIALYSTAVATIVNIFFDYALVYGKYGFSELGVSGAAWGSIIGLLAGIMVYVIDMTVVNKKHMNISFSRKAATRMIKLYMPLLGQDIMECTVFTMIITGIVSRLGISGIVSYNLLENLGSMVILPMYAFSTAAITLSIQKKASGDNIAVKSILRTSIFMSLVIVIFISIVCITFPEKILALIVSDMKTIETTKTLIVYMIILQFIKIFYQIYKSYLQGTDNEKFVFITSVAGSLLSVTWIYLLSIVLGIGGIYIGLSINYIFLSLIYLIKIKKSMQEN